MGNTTLRKRMLQTTHLEKHLVDLNKRELQAFINNNKLMSQYYIDTLKELTQYLALF